MLIQKSKSCERMRPIIILSTKYIHEDKNEDCDRFCPSADAQEEYARLRRNEELLLSRLGLLTKSAAGDGDIQRSDDYHPSNSAFSDNGSSKVLLNKVLLYTAQSPSTPDVGVDGTIHQPFSDRIEHLERPDEDERDDDIMAIHHQPAHHHTHEIPQTLHPVTARVAAEDVDQEQLFYLPIGRSAQRRTRHRWEESNDAPMPRNSHYDIKNYRSYDENRVRRVRFVDPVVTEVKITPKVSKDEVPTLFYTLDDMLRFRHEIYYTRHATCENIVVDFFYEQARKFAFMLRCESIKAE